MRIGDPDARAERGEGLGDRGAGRFAGVTRVAFVRKAEQEDAGSLHGPAPPVEGEEESAHHVVGHVLVHVVRQLDEAEGLAEAAAHLPREVARVDGEAVSADARPGREAEIPERLARSGIDGLPYVDVEIGGEHRQLVDKGDVDVTEGVLEQLGELGLSGARHRDGPLHDPVVERLHRLARGFVDAGDDLRGVLEPPLEVAGVDALGAVAEVELAPGGQSGRLLENRGDQLFGRPGVAGRLQHDRAAWTSGGRRRLPPPPRHTRGSGSPPAAGSGRR